MNRILIIKLGSIGDVVHTFPALSDLRASFPQARIDWLVERQAGVLLRNHPWLNQVIEVDTRKWRRALWQPQTWREIRRCLNRLRQRRYEVAFDFQGLWKVGDLRPLFRFPLAGGVRQGPFERTRLPHPLRPTGVAGIPRPATSASSIERWWAAREPPEAKGGSSWQRKSRTGLTSTPGWPNAAWTSSLSSIPAAAGWTKNWSPANYGLLHQRIRRELGLKTVLTWGPGEEDLVREVMAACPGDPPSTFSTTLPQFMALARRARLFVGGDTGPLHLAAACQTPVVAIFGPNRPPQERSPAPGRPGGFPPGSLRALLQEDLPEVPAPVHDPGHGRSSVRCGREAAGSKPAPKLRAN